MNWTEERVELLKQLWAEGYSASQIAVKMGGVTRNAVIGKAHRLKLAARTKTRARLAAPAAAEELPAAEVPQERAPQQEQFAAAGNGGKGRRSFTRVVGNAALQVEFVAEAAAEAAPQKQKGVVVKLARPRHLTLMQLTERTCKWPLGDPMSRDFSFCGAETEESGPYCSCHAKLAFNSAADKRKN